MHYKFTKRDWINLIAIIGICGLTLLLVSMASGAKAVELPGATETVAVFDIPEPSVETTEATETIKTIDTTEPTEVIEVVEVVIETEPTEYVEPTPIPTEPQEIPQTEPQETVPEPSVPTVCCDQPYDENTDVVDLLACVIFQEAGGDDYCNDCRRRVADVVLNRVAHADFPDTIYGVLTQECQYGRFAWTGVVWPERAQYDCEAHAVERAYQIAREVLNGKHSDLYGKGYIWQAEFSQGIDEIYHCGHYFGR